MGLAGEGVRYDGAGFVEYLASLADDHPIASIEDGMDEGDWAGWSMLTQRLGDRVQLVGDDLFVTNTRILKRGIDAGSGELHSDQNSTRSAPCRKRWTPSPWRARPAIRRWFPTVPAKPKTRPIADLAVGAATGQIKTGSLCRSDRVAKYNQLLRNRGSARCAGALSWPLGDQTRVKLLFAALVLLIVGLQYRAWSQRRTVYFAAKALNERLERQQRRAELQRQRNRILAAEVLALKRGDAAVEARARRDLGMILEGETFYIVAEELQPEKANGLPASLPGHLCRRRLVSYAGCRVPGRCGPGTLVRRSPHQPECMGAKGT